MSRRFQSSIPRRQFAGGQARNDILNGMADAIWNHVMRKDRAPMMPTPEVALTCARDLESAYREVTGLKIDQMSNRPGKAEGVRLADGALSRGTLDGGKKVFLSVSFEPDADGGYLAWSITRCIEDGGEGPVGPAHENPTRGRVKPQIQTGFQGEETRVHCPKCRTFMVDTGEVQEHHLGNMDILKCPRCGATAWWRPRMVRPGVFSTDADEGVVKWEEGMIEFPKPKRKARKNPGEDTSDDLTLEAIRGGFAWAIWESAVNHYKAETGERRVDQEDDIPEAAWDAADYLIGVYELASDAPTGMRHEQGAQLLAVFRAAAAADDANPDEYEYAQSFGWHLAMMAMGHGVSWFDDHAKADIPKVDAEVHLHQDALSIEARPRGGHLSPGLHARLRNRLDDLDEDEEVLRRSEADLRKNPVPHGVRMRMRK